MNIKNTVVIHPSGDDSTQFLRLVYGRWPARALEVEDSALTEFLGNYRVVAMGHGFQCGLFDASYKCILSDEHASALKKGVENVFIWCYASDFMRAHDLKGFATGMFISEVREADFFGVPASEDEINASNDLFASIVGDCLHFPSATIYERVLRDYVIPGNKVVEYNRARMYLSA